MNVYCYSLKGENISSHWIRFRDLESVLEDDVKNDGTCLA